MQQAIFTNGKVNGVPTLLLVDTGSAVTIIHHRLWEQGRASTLQKVDGGPIVAANGQSLSILGQVKSHILLAGGEFIHDVLVADVSQDCLLGADFLTAHGLIHHRLQLSHAVQGGPVSTSGHITQSNMRSVPGVHW